MLIAGPTKDSDSFDKSPIPMPLEEEKKPRVPKLKLNLLSKNNELRRPLSSRYKNPSPFKQGLDQDIFEREDSSLVIQDNIHDRSLILVEIPGLPK